MAALRTTIYLEAKDRHALQEIQRRYGLATLSDAIRFSIRVVQGVPQASALAPPETALARCRPVRGQRRTREPQRPEALMTRAQQASRTAQRIVTQTTAFLDERRRGRERRG